MNLTTKRPQNKGREERKEIDKILYDYANNISPYLFLMIFADDDREPPGLRSSFNDGFFLLYRCRNSTLFFSFRFSLIFYWTRNPNRCIATKMAFSRELGGHHVALGSSVLLAQNWWIRAAIFCGFITRWSGYGEAIAATMFVWYYLCSWQASKQKCYKEAR